MSKKKILFITGEFLPYTQSVGGVIRIISFISSLRKNNIKLISLKKKKYGYFGFQKYLKNIDKIYVDSNRLINGSWLNIIILGLKRFFSNSLYILGIDNNFFNIKKIQNKTVKILNSFNPEYIIISAPPFSLFKLVNIIRKKSKKIKIILDYRDGWTLRVNSLLTYPLKIFMTNKERNIVDNANYILCATSKIHQDLSKITNKNKIILLNNGYFRKIKKENNKKFNPNQIKLGYFGLISDSTNSYRDVKVIYKSLPNRNKLNFTFYGNSIIKNTKIKNYKKFNFKKNISYFNALLKMQEFDYLLILHTEKSTSKEVVTGKFYEYLSSGVPIVLISNGETEVGKLIKKYNLGHAIDYSKQSLSKFFVELSENKMKFKTIKDIKRFSREEQNKKLLKIIN